MNELKDIVKSETVEMLVIMLDDLSLIQQLGGNGSIGNDPMLTNYFIRAFLDAGFPRNHTPLRLSKDWLLKVVQQRPEIDPFILHSLILLGEYNVTYVQEKLKELTTKRRKKDGRFELPAGYILQGDLFSTMFALDIILSLKNPYTYLGEDDIKCSFDWCLRHYDDIGNIKDKTFLIHLLSRFDLKKYQNNVEEKYYELIPGIELIYKNIKNAIENDEIKEILENIENFLWIVYDLQILYSSFPEVKTLVDSSIRLIEEKILPKLISFYSPKSEIKMDTNVIYFKTRLASLLISVLSGYYKEDLKNKILEYVLNQRTKLISGYLYRTHFEEQARIREAHRNLLKEWLDLKIEKIEELSGGFSGARIYRVKSKIIVPINNQIFSVPSIIIKRSTKETFEKEIENYRKIPPYLKSHFAKITEETLSIPSGDSLEVFLIMEDLVNYKTLKEVLEEKVKKNNKETLHRFLEVICKLLKLIYESSKEEANQEEKNTVLSRYFQDTFKSISDLMVVSKNRDSIIKILEYMERLFRDIDKLQLPFTTIMHGDLNCRNIMIRTTEQGLLEEFKLIDIDHLAPIGDYAFDIGELVVDISASIDGGENISKVIEDFFRKFSLEASDGGFDERLKIAKIRSWIKLAKIYSNMGRDDLSEKSISEIMKIINKEENKS